MSDEGEAGRRVPKRARVTLKWDSTPLRLPGEAERETDADELAQAPGGIEVPLAGVEGEGADAWERQAPRLTPAPFASLASEPAEFSSETGGALDLVDRRSRPISASVDLAVEMSDRYALGDYTAALQIAELILGRDPAHEAARHVAASCRARLEQLYRSRLGSLARVPRVAVDSSEMRWLGLDHRAAFLLSRVDGHHTLADLVDVSGMSALEALKTIVELLELGAIRLGD